MKLTKKLFFIFTMSLIISSCYDSVNPLGNLQDAVIDDNLIGLWVFNNKLSDGKIEKGYFIIQKGLNKYYHIYTQDKPFIFNNSMYSNFQAYIIKINKQYYLNLQPLQIVDGKHVTKNTNTYIFANFSLKKNKITLKLFNDKFILEAIKKKMIEGQILKTRSNKIAGDGKITESSKKLTQFVRRNKKKILSNKVLFLRKMRIK